MLGKGIKLLIQNISRKQIGFSLVEMLLILVIAAILLSGVAFYFLKFTDYGKSLLVTNDDHSEKSQLSKTVTLPVVRHNQLIVSLLNKPIQTNTADGKVLFPFENDVKVGTEWPTQDFGLLVKATDGKASSAQLLGYRYMKTNNRYAQDGYDVLKNLDTNNDNKIDKNDIDFNNIYIWTDLNQDGIIDQNELKSLTELGIVSIDLNSFKQTNEKINQSIITRKGQVTFSNGTKGMIADVDLFQDPFFRRFVTPLPISADIKKLPNTRGYGLVRDLQEATTLNVNLFSILTDYLAADSNGRLSRMDKLLFEWAKTSHYPSLNSRLKDISTSKFDFSLDKPLSTNRYETGLGITKDLLREILVLEAFNAKGLLNFLAQEVLNSTTQTWELHLTIAYKDQLMGKWVFSVSDKGGQQKIAITEEMLNFSAAQKADIESQYAVLKQSLFDSLQANAADAANVNNGMQWVDFGLKEQIETGQIYRPRQITPQDIPRRRPVSECIKPGNIIDPQVRECADGKIPKTW